MTRSLRTGISGLKSNQTRLDVVGNNIANLNTTAFKGGRAAFSEVLGQKLLGVGRTAGGSGINPSYVGLGVTVGSIDQNWGQGSLEKTDVATDLALSGDGFFVAQTTDGRNLMTRAGNFTFNSNGELTTSSGINVQGWKFNDDGKLNTGKLQDVQIPPNAQSPAKPTDEISIGGNLASELEVGDTTSISTAVYDPKGNAKSVVVEFEKTQAVGGGNTEATYDFRLKDEDGNVLTDQGGTAQGGTLTFDQQGNLTDVDGAGAPFTSQFSWDADGDATDETFTLDFGNGEGKGLVTQYSGSTTATVREQNGHASGTLTGYGINPEGILELNFSNGEQKELYQLAIGNVNNPNGLQQEGENFYSTTSASGDLQLGRAGRDLRTSVVSGTLEMSNVDIASEFTDMIVAQRGYQASARVITTSDEMLQEAVQLKR